MSTGAWHFRCGYCWTDLKTDDVVSEKDDPAVDVLSVWPSSWARVRNDETGEDKIACQTCAGPIAKAIIETARAQR